MRASVALLTALALGLLACGGGGGAPPGGGGGGGGGGGTAPTSLVYATNPAFYRAGQAIPPNTATVDGSPAPTFSVLPALPAGLVLDATTGAISGTAATATPSATFTVTATNAAGATSAQLALEVGSALPAAFESLAQGFSAAVVQEGLLKPVKMAPAPDGRVFFNELDTGNTRVLEADGSLRTTVFAHTDVVTGGYGGLLGLALAPDFATSGHVYVMATVPAVGGLPNRLRITRFTEVPGLLQGTNETIVMDGLPWSVLNDGGDLVFAPDGTLFASVGDVEDPALAQTDGSRAGRILRMNADGSVPSDNPFGPPDAYEWNRGLRNTFALAIQPTTGELFGADNGPATNDYLHYHRAGKNFQWGGLPPGFPPGEVGIRITGWPDVIAPTALAFHTGVAWGAAYANDLFLAHYDHEGIRRLILSGPQFLNLDEEQVFATLDGSGLNKPLDLFVAADGALWVSTFVGIYRITKD
jgi:glucose/arabinose dehydrogenase